MAASFKLCTPRGLRAKLGNTSYLGVACWVCSLSCVCLFALKQKTSTNVNDVILEKKEVFSNEAMLTSPSGYKYEGTVSFLVILRCSSFAFFLRGVEVCTVSHNYAELENIPQVADEWKVWQTNNKFQLALFIELQFPDQTKIWIFRNRDLSRAAPALLFKQMCFFRFIFLSD